jgi:hypothetical protein
MVVVNVMKQGYCGNDDGGEQAYRSESRQAV